MKRLILIISVLFFSVMSVSAQDVETQPRKFVYCNVMGYNFFGVGKVKVQLDLGRKNSMKGYDSLYGDDGKKIKFNTMMEVLNYMAERGWKCIGTYYITSGSGNVIHYLLEKGVKSDEEITEGLNLMEEG